MMLFSEWGGRKRRRRAMKFSLKLNKIDAVDRWVLLSRKPNILQLLPALLLRESLLGPSLMADLLEET